MDRMNFRSLPIGTGAPASLDDKSRSVEVIAATEQPVAVFDYEQYEIIDEVLLMAGCEMPGNRQVVLLDTHDRSNGTGSVLGSFRGMTISNDQLVGRVHFSTRAADAWEKVREGHLTDVSIGYRPVQSTWVPEGETAVVKGRSFTGPVKVTTRWRVKELSICPIGADELAKTRSQPPATGETKGNVSMTPEEIRAEAQRVERERVTEIRAMCDKYDLPDLGKKLVADGTDLDQARKAVLAELEKRPQPNVPHRTDPIYTHGADASDKRNAAIVDGLTLRAGVHLDAPAPGASEYQGIDLPSLARECLVAAGVRVSGRSKSACVGEALQLQTRAMMTPDFPLLLANVANKVLRESFQTAPSTFQHWTRKGSTSDFKENSRVSLSAYEGLDEIPENVPYKYGTHTEMAEKFSVLTYGKLFALTRQAIVNDDLGALTNIPRAAGAAAKRLINKLVYDHVLANGLMSDGVALFHAAHGNTPESGGAPGDTTLDTARVAMRTQTGLAGEVLGIAPKFLIVSAEGETVADVLLNSLASTATDLNSGVKNPWRGLELLVEPYLDAASAAKKWFLTADARAFDTVEVCYLDGRDQPYLETRDGWTVDGVEYKVRLDVGVKAVDWRGLFYNPGE
ncbi:prohead protease/major capsid protein fusion protein [Desulfatitalea alkaliphila]|uniref:Mu-like prophage major head subunit gpT family protein n=1 Tax=Desulfatitalea alkaliphila TaxID=2929485 RepID=A0AA41R3B4_9BACT|nr:prohead protease/major capsid protein fusion protein [Desulfatitalea alkaliphila]MCJ8502367.1 Mu-like prophage major head subunit gpT family protein [Desulfatitalea alkaliphila]